MTAPFMKFYPGDYMGKTHHLDVVEHGAYFLLILAAWNAGGALPDDDAKLARFAHCSKAQWSRVRVTVRAFFVAEHGILRHRRVTEELAKYAEFVERQAKSGKASAQAKALKTKEPASTVVQPECNQPEPEPERKDTAAKPQPVEQKSEPVEPAFEEAWKAATDTMRRRSSKSQALAAWRVATKRAAPDAMLAAVKRYRSEDPDVGRTGGPGLHIWLRESRWEHWLAKPSSMPIGAEIPPEVLQSRIQHYRDTHEWRTAWGPMPKEIAA